MTQLLLNLLPTVTAPTVSGTSANASASTPASATEAAGGDEFRSALAGQLVAPAQPAPAATATSTAGSLLTALEAKIKRMLDAGASQADVIASLAASLTTATANQLGITSANARSQLQAAFAAALAPSGGSGPASAISSAATARSLAARFAAVKQMADTLAGQPNGQQSRLTGPVLDAPGAKDTPAQPVTTNTGSPSAVPAAAVASQPAPDTAVASATAAPSASALFPASPASQLPSQQVAATSALTAGLDAGDGRTVAIDQQSAIANGGNSLLGRILTRASVAATARAAAAATAAASSAANAPESDDTASASETTAVSAFIKSFAAAVAANDQSAPDPAASAAATAAPVAHTVTDSTPAFVPTVAPFTIDRLPSAQTHAAPAAPAATPVDPSDIADQILRGAFMRNVGQSSEMRLSLVPASLGDVSVKLVVGNAGDVTAHVIAETSDVRDALVAAQPQLTKSLAEAGMKLSSFTVDLAGGGFAGFAQQQNDRQNTGRQQRSNAPSETDDLTGDDARLDAIPTFGPSIAGSSSDYNYLV